MTVSATLEVELASAAVDALIDEAQLTPKPALVDRRGNGAHHDLDVARLERSAHALQDGFEEIARAAVRATPSLALREELGRIGRAMEQRMQNATDGHNAHRGAIWALGLLVAAAAQRGANAPAREIADVAAQIARLPDRFAPHLVSHGERVRLRFHAAGARGEAQRGFPHVVRLGLPALRRARARRAREQHAQLDALMAIMSSLDDTCLLYRGGRAALDTARSGARAVLAAGGTSGTEGLRLLHRLHHDLMVLWASPGGSADLLAATLFLDRLETGSWRH